MAVNLSNSGPNMIHVKNNRLVLKNWPMIGRLVRRVHDPGQRSAVRLLQSGPAFPVADVIDDEAMPLVRIGRVRQFDGRYASGAPILFPYVKAAEHQPVVLKADMGRLPLHRVHPKIAIPG